MQCKSCRERWKLADGIDPGRISSPAEFVLASIGQIGFAVLAAVFDGWILAALLSLPAFYGFTRAILRCGHQCPRWTYQGSICPKCGTDNFIWPWNF